MHIQFFGAAGTVTGSNYLLSDDRGYGILVDMGMFQGSEELEKLNYKPLSFDAHEVHSIFLTHAHLDHVGRLPIVMKHGFSGKIYMTTPTKELSEVVLRDAAKIMQHDKDKPILYTEEDVFDLLNHTETVSYGEQVDLGDIKAVFRDAGHILGSASIEIHFQDSNKSVVFSGDLGNSPEDLVRPTEFIKQANIVVMESTYGDQNHPTEDPNAVLLHEINEVESSGGTLLIPSFSIERTQTLLHRISHFKDQGHVKSYTPVIMDSPMAQKVTEIYKQFPELFNDSLKGESHANDPFSFPGLRVIDDHKDSLKIEELSGPKVIIAGSGMMNGGRILNHAAFYLPQKTTRLLIVGFQGENTLGRKIEEGVQSVEIDGKIININATINKLHSMSAHADQRGLVEWLRHINGVEQVFLTHGEEHPREVLRDKIHDLGIKNVYLPEIDEYKEL